MEMVAEEEDRLSSLPDDIIHHIFSFLDMKYAVQTCILAHKWKFIWTSMPCLNFNIHTFNSSPQFARFVEHALSHRNTLTEVSAVNLTFTKATTTSVAESIVNYASSHNVKQLTMIWSSAETNLKFPQYIFSCHTLKHLTLAADDNSLYFRVPILDWDFPVLETLNLRNIKFGDTYGVTKNMDLFSKCVNLKDLTLHMCSMYNSEIFTVRASQLSNLTITNALSFPKVLNVVAPHLQNLTASLNAKYSDSLLPLTTEGFDSLQKVNLFLPIYAYKKETHVPLLLDLFQKLHTAKFLILNVGILKALSSCMDQVWNEACPFDNLKSVKIDTESLKQKDLKCLNNFTCLMRLNYNEHILTMAAQAKNYFLHNSPVATFIVDLPDIPHQVRRNKQEMKDKVIKKLVSRIIKCKMGALKVQVTRGYPNYELIHLMRCEINSVMDLLIPESLTRVKLEEEFCSQYEVLKSKLVTLIDGNQWAKIETKLLPY